MKRTARQRIEEAADRMAAELLKMATDGNVADSVKLAAIRDALDRAGLAAKNAVEVEVGPPKPYEVLLERIGTGSRIEAGSRAEYRGLRGAPDISNQLPLAVNTTAPPAKNDAVRLNATDDPVVSAPVPRGGRRSRGF